MKILHIITQGEAGGAQRHVRDVLRELAACGHDVFVATGKQSKEKDRWLFDSLRESGFSENQLMEIPSLQRELSLTRDIRAFFSTMRLIRRIAPDIVHAHSSKAGVVCGIAVRLLGVPVVYTAHGFVFSESISFLRKIFYIAAEQVASWFRTMTIVVSEADKRIGERYRIVRKGRVAVIHNGIDRKEKEQMAEKSDARRALFQKIERNNLNTDGPIIIGSIANAYATKGLAHLVGAASLFLKARDENDSPVLFIVIGEGPLRASLERAVREKGISENFFFLGAIEDAWALLPGFDLFVLPSIKEGLPYTILEALLAGVPCIATDVGGVPEIAAQAPITLVPPANSHALAEAISSSLRDSSLKRNDALPDEFTVERMIEKIIRVYQQIM